MSYWHKRQLLIDHPDCVQGQHPNSFVGLARLPPFTEPQAHLLLLWLREDIFFLSTQKLLFVAPKNSIHNKWCKKRQWQHLICRRIAKQSTWLTVNSSLPGLLAELTCLGVYKLCTDLCMCGSEGRWLVALLHSTIKQSSMLGICQESLPFFLTLAALTHSAQSSCLLLPVWDNPFRTEIKM